MRECSDRFDQANTVFNLESPASRHLGDGSAYNRMNRLSV